MPTSLGPNLAAHAPRDDITETYAQGPQPASGPIDRATAEWYQNFTHGQFTPMQRNGHWFLTMSAPTWSA